MSVQSPTERTAVSDSDRLIETLQSCFCELLKRQEQQADRLRQAVEALNTKPAGADKKTAFWNAYKTLADEHDREFQQRYSTDLDTCLIFAGLFSAVESAFIVQIQPEIQPDNTATIILVAQSLLYISLGSTLLAALLAVLGKQWLVYYSAAGVRGTAETRGMERQRKMDGLRQWRFDTVMQIFPYLLQLGLLLFSVALSIYLWTIHLSLAIIVLSFTSLGLGGYILLLLSTVISPESPYQTPLSPLVFRSTPTTLWPNAGQKLKNFISRISTRSSALLQRGIHNHSSRHLLPNFSQIDSKATEKPRELNSFFDAEFPKPSPEVPAVSWVLETSTDPHMVTVAAEIAVTLQWPSSMDLQPQLIRLRDGFLTCFDFTPLGNSVVRLNSLRDGMSRRATHLGRAYCALRCVHPSLEPDHDLRTEISPMRFPRLHPELANVLQILEIKPDVFVGSDAPLATKWALHVIPLASRRYEDSDARQRALEYFLHQFDDEIPKLSPSSFGDYLFCVNSFLSPARACDTVWMDKSQFQGEMFEHLFTTLGWKLGTGEIPMSTAAQIIETTGRIASGSETNVWYHSFHYHRRQSAIYRFCQSLNPDSDGWVDVVLATGLLIGSHNYLRGYRNSRDANWVYRALTAVPVPNKEEDQWDSRTITGISSLLDTLLCHGAPPIKEHLHMLLHALSIPGDISENAARLLVRDSIYEDGQFRPSFSQDSSVWLSLTRVGGIAN